MKLFFALLLLVAPFVPVSAHAGTPLSWEEVFARGEGILRSDLVFPRGFLVEGGTHFKVEERLELEGLGVYMMRLQADACSDILHIEEMMGIEPKTPRSKKTPVVGVTWDPGCQTEIYYEISNTDALSLFDLNE